MIFMCSVKVGKEGFSFKKLLIKKKHKFKIQKLRIRWFTKNELEYCQILFTIIFWLQFFLFNDLLVYGNIVINKKKVFVLITLIICSIVKYNITLFCVQYPVPVAWTCNPATVGSRTAWVQGQSPSYWGKGLKEHAGARIWTSCLRDTHTNHFPT